MTADEASAPDEGDGAFTPYQKRLFAFLSVATFFEGYDFIALTQVLPNLRADMGVTKTAAGVLITVINLGSMIAYLLVRKADRWGRRRVLTITIAGYAITTFLSGLAPNVVVFGLAQMLARVFLVGEYVTSMVIASEEFPARRRGLVIGVIAAFSSLGAVVCAGLVPVLIRSPYGWRTVYLVSILPLVIMGFARRSLRETQRFLAAPKEESPRSILHVFRTPYRKRVLELGLIWFFSYVASQNTVTFWKDFAVTERGYTDADVGVSVAIAAVAAMPLVFLTGRLIDGIGRKPGALIVGLTGAFGAYGCYTFETKEALLVALVFGIFSSSAQLPVLNAFTTELIPTDVRADGFAWSNNIIGRISFVFSPLVVGYLAQDLGWGPVIRMTAVFPLVALALVYLFLPETRGRTLEETAAL